MTLDDNGYDNDHDADNILSPRSKEVEIGFEDIVPYIKGSAQFNA